MQFSLCLSVNLAIHLYLTVHFFDLSSYLLHLGLFLLSIFISQFNSSISQLIYLCLAIHPFIYLCPCLSINSYLSTHPSMRLALSLSFCLPTRGQDLGSAAGDKARGLSETDKSLHALVSDCIRRTLSPHQDVSRCDFRVRLEEKTRQDSRRKIMPRGETESQKIQFERRSGWLGWNFELVSSLSFSPQQVTRLLLDVEKSGGGGGGGEGRDF